MAKVKRLISDSEFRMLRDDDSLEPISQYPTIVEVEAADRSQLVRWHGCLVEPRTVDDRTAWARIRERLFETYPS